MAKLNLKEYWRELEQKEHEGRGRGEGGKVD